MNAKIENLITAKNDVFKKYLKNNRNRYYTYKYKALQWKLQNLKNLRNKVIIKEFLETNLYSVLVLNVTSPY